MKINSDKCHLFISGNKFEHLWVKISKPQFKYCPLRWTFYSRITNNRINHLQERSLGLVYDGCKLNFDELLEKDESSLSIIAIFRHYALNYIMYTITYHKLFSVSCLHEKIVPIT